jgi:hypothetical protein
MINKPAPQPVLECWAQGGEPAISELTGQVILIEVIQVNCPGCFVHALPEAIRLHQTYMANGLKVYAIATAFEHFEHNTLDNLQRLLQHGELQGEPLSQLGKAGFLDDGKLPYTIPFSVAMDKLVKDEAEVSEKDITQFILSQIPGFFQGGLNDDTRQAIYQQAENYLLSRTHRALTFDMYNLQGTPSCILIDKKGIFRRLSFGPVGTLERDIQELLDE